MALNVLVLNQDFTPLSICSHERAFLLIFLGKAELIHAYDIPLRSVNKSYDRPSVIKVNRYVSVPYKGVTLTRQNVFKRDGFKCQYCGDTENLTIDHVVPKSKGGKTSWKNVTTACNNCNANKSDKDLDEIDMNLLSTPFKPSPFFYLVDKQGKFREEWKVYFYKKR